MFALMLCKLMLNVSTLLQIFVVEQHKSFAILEVLHLFSQIGKCMFVELVCSCTTYGCYIGGMLASDPLVII